MFVKGIVMVNQRCHALVPYLSLPDQALLSSESHSVTPAATQPLGLSLPLRPNNASGRLESISMTKVTTAQLGAASLH